MVPKIIRRILVNSEIILADKTCSKTKSKSAVWTYFAKEGNNSARCTLFTKVLKHGGNTTNLAGHLKRVHPLHISSDSESEKSVVKDDPVLPKRPKTTVEQSHTGRAEVLIIIYYLFFFVDSLNFGNFINF